jgi:hypothetical protein
MELHRISAKFFLAEPDGFDLAAVVPVFHRWIQERTVEGMPVDVADYRHVPDGPGVVLIGHEGDLAVDCVGGRVGVLYRRKRDMTGTLAERIAAVLRSAAAAAARLESDPAFAGKVRIRTDEAELTLLDRLRAPDTAAAFGALRPEIEKAAKAVFGGSAAAVERGGGDGRAALSVMIRPSAAPALSTIAARK